MKSTVLTGALLLATGTMTHAQLSFLPQVGFEQSRTTLNYNALSTSGIEGALKANLRADYRLKGGHGPFINLGTSPAPVNFAFNNTGDLVKNFQATKNNLQFRIETGYQYTSKPIQFKKSPSLPTAETSETLIEKSTQKKSCGSAAYQSNCSNKKKSVKKVVVPNNNLNMRLQPSLGFAYVPSNNESIKQTADGFEYNATAWKTAIVPAMGFEFAKGRQRLLTLTVFCTKPLGLQDETVTTSVNSKAVVTHLNPCASTWGMMVGVPFSFAKSNVVKTKKVKTDSYKSYYRKCSKI